MPRQANVGGCVAGELDGEPAEARKHTVESSTGQVAALADLIVDSTRPVIEIADEVQRLGAIAAARPGCSRVEWMTDRGNQDSRGFYRALGCEEFDGKVVYRVASQAG